MGGTDKPVKAFVGMRELFRSQPWKVCLVQVQGINNAEICLSSSGPSSKECAAFDMVLSWDSRGTAVGEVMIASLAEEENGQVQISVTLNILAVESERKIRD